MKLTKPDVLFLHSLLFHFLTQDHGSDVSSRVHDLMNDMEDFLLSGEEEETESEQEEDALEEEQEDDVDAEEEEEDTEVEAEDFLTPEAAGKLPPVTVTSPTGEKVTLEFEDVGEDDLVDVLIDDGSVIIDSVTQLKVTQSSVEVYDGEQWHVFAMKRLPKSWKAIDLDTVYGFSVEKGQDEEE